MRPPESSSRSRAAVACTTGERVKALAMPVPMRMRSVAWRDRAEHREGVLVEELGAPHRGEARRLGALRELELGPRAAADEDQSRRHAPPLLRPPGESSLSKRAEETAMKQRRLGRDRASWSRRSASAR